MEQNQNPTEAEQHEQAETDRIANMDLPQVEQAVLSNPRKPKRKLYIILLLALLLIAGAALAYMLLKPAKTKVSSVTVKKSTVSTAQTTSVKTEGTVLDEKKNYGNKYANGILPVGDSKYSADAAKDGYVYACSGYASNLAKGGGGAGQRGPWFVGTTSYEPSKKLKIQGAVKWQASFSDKLAGATRTITTNDLPVHITGTFPVSPTDPAYAYDRNPNTISAQDFSYSLNASPSYGDPKCIGGQVGVMLSGVAIFSGFDAAGRDAGAWEVQDSCGGHPEKSGTYHYHTLSSCITDVNVKTVIGFALDGFPITGPKLSDNNILTSTDLDVCHGITSQVVLDGKTVTTYHYVVTQDFPYSLSCYRSTAAQPPGQQGPPQN